MTCIGEPISWLRLEQYQLGQLPQIERAGIAEHLLACGACRACLDSIKADASELPPLWGRAESAQRSGVRDSPARTSNVVPLRRKLVAFAALAAAACLAAVIVSQLPVITHVKGGGTVALTLSREDGAEITKDGVFRDGDAFKAFATCAPQSKWYFDLVVYDASGASFPVATPGELACGNLAPIQGAFHFTGHDEETVCLVWSERAPDRAVLRKGLESLGPNRDCKTLKPAR
ncbi:MAG: zf-HC2 domain-containing protein [Myxococcaceae bacterium]